MLAIIFCFLFFLFLHKYFLSSWESSLLPFSESVFHKCWILWIFYALIDRYDYVTFFFSLLNDGLLWDQLLCFNPNCSLALTDVLQLNSGTNPTPPRVSTYSHKDPKDCLYFGCQSQVNGVPKPLIFLTDWLQVPGSREPFKFNILLQWLTELRKVLYSRSSNNVKCCRNLTLVYTN